MKIALTILSYFVLINVVQARQADTTQNNKPVDTLKIVYFGSSVPYGIGATKNFGYTWQFTKILKQRQAAGLGKAWTTVNKSIGGDNTPKLIKRWHRDFVSQHAKYVLIALSLGNEGIHESGQPKYDQFKANLPKLIAIARDSGYVPVVTNCYTRNDFTAKDYDWVKQMNLFINSLDVPSVNLLGGVDDGTGKWAAGNWFNPAHPNDAGHLELAYTLVPSLFDALANHKSQPKWIDASALNLGGSSAIDFKPENIVHPFTTTITIKADAKGQLMELRDSSTTHIGSIKITDQGFVEYTSPLYQQILGSTKITDGQWHKITLTHYYARNITQLYCDTTLQGHVAERLVLKELSLGGDGGKNISAKNWLFYRSGMNLSEVKAMVDNTLLKSSLELYAPLDEKHTALGDVLVNLAQSTNTLSWVKR